MSTPIIINRNLSNGNQSWNYDEIVEVPSTTLGNPDKLRVEIRRNSYDDQSFARVSFWTPAGWSTVAALPIADCRCAAVSYTSKSLTMSQQEAFDLDSERLIDIAMAVIR